MALEKKLARLCLAPETGRMLTKCEGAYVPSNSRPCKGEIVTGVTIYMVTDVTDASWGTQRIMF